MRVFIFGAGYSGKAIAKALAPEAAQISGTTRNADGLEDVCAAEITPFVFDGKQLGDAIRAELAGATHFVTAISPDNGGDPVLPLLEHRLREVAPALKWIGYLSTVGVYGDHGGAWVNEETACRPVSRRSIARLAAEARWSALGADADIPTAIIRLSGIYGPGRNTFRNFEKGTARRLVKPGQVFNRIHVADIAGATALLARRRLDGIWNVTDNEPAPPQDLVTLAAELMGEAPPELVPFEEAELTPMARSFYGENKRVSNAKVRAAGYSFRYPSYRMALPEMWENSEW